jgi:glutaminyl-tRNA synthetase
MAETTETPGEALSPGVDFIREIINEDLRTGKNGTRVATRFPPEPNGYLHIGHAKSICLNFGIARDYKGTCNLRMDDSNPCKEEQEYVDSIKRDVQWIGFQWDGEFHASDYFEEMYRYAEELIRRGKAYVCSLNADQIREYRGTLTEPGRESPDRNRPPAESLDLFRRMRAGEFPDGKYTLRAKIDMASPNLNMRDPAMYRIRHAAHQRTGDKWCIYPMYDYCHCISDSIERITHSICTLEFEDHRPLYDWFLDQLPVPSHPQQIEFARLNITYTMLSKRKLLELVNTGYVSGWDDPRMPTLAGLRRRGFTPEGIRLFCSRIGVAKANSTVNVDLLEFCLREDLNKRAKRVMAVLDPLKVVIDNYAEGKFEELTAENNPEDLSAGTRKIPFGREIYIEREDFMENPLKKFFRLAPGVEVRLKHAYLIRCERVVKDPQTGAVLEVHCSYDPQTLSGTGETRKVKGTLHWVCAAKAVDAEVRLYDHLFIRENPEDVPEGQDWRASLNPQSLEVRRGCKLEPSLAQAQAGVPCQFLRLGYFCVDSVDHKPGALVFNRTVTLRDTWAKIQKKES